MMKRYCLTLDFQDDHRKIADYETHHRNVWPGIKASIKNSGIKNIEIFRHGTRLCMIIEAEDDFSFERKKEMDERNPLVREWEELMWNYQAPVPGAAPGEKWVLMNKIFELK